MPKPARLPTELSTQFTVGEALAAGVTARRLRAADLESDVWGVRSSQRSATLQDRCLLFQSRLASHTFFSHGTAALLHGMRLPWSLAHRIEIDVSVPAPVRAPDAGGIIGHSIAVSPAEVTVRGELRMTTPERTWLDLATLLELGDLVAAGDFLIHWRTPLCTLQRLRLTVSTHGSGRGIARVRTALSLLNDHAESAPESLLRVILAQAGFIHPKINHAVSDRFGEFVARTDFRFDILKLVLEYQGDYHRTSKGQWRADMTRRAKLEALGWRVMEVNADDLRDPVELIARIRSLLANR